MKRNWKDYAPLRGAACSFSSFRWWLACGIWRNAIWIHPLQFLVGLLTCLVLHLGLGDLLNDLLRSIIRIK